MAISLQRFEQLRRQVEKDRREADKAAGVLEQLRKDIKRDWGVKDEDALERLLKEQRKELAAMEKEFEAGVEKLEEQYGEALE